MSYFYNLIFNIYSNTFSSKEAVDHRADSKYRNKDDTRNHQRVVHA
jgi:hypothetical protein